MSKKEVEMRRFTYGPEVVSNKRIRKSYLNRIGRNTYEIYPKPVTTKSPLYHATKQPDI